ncbi:MAG: response regulator [Oligoflexus sp.]|nr:response regulator [Oligoflexus sp.]
MERSDLYVINEIEHILAEFQPEARGKNVGLLYEAMTALPPKIVTDPVCFRQILVNIVGNAVKFTDRGQVKIQLSLVPKTLAEDPGSYLHIDVSDTGCGISPDQFQLLFKPFSQVDATNSRRFGGTGLGLSLARRLGEGLGGGVQLLRSELGVGSTFRITIDPQVEINAIAANLSQDDDLLKEQAIKAIDPTKLQGFKVLVVEDGEDNRLIISRLLKKAGALVECVENGEEAIRAVGRQSYDVILMDIQLPQMDGYEVTTKLRKQGCKTAIVALTAHTLIEDRVKAQRAGFDAFLSKPIDWAKLVGTLGNFKTAGSPVLH